MFCMEAEAEDGTVKKDEPIKSDKPEVPEKELVALIEEKSGYPVIKENKLYIDGIMPGWINEAVSMEDGEISCGAGK